MNIFQSKTRFAAHYFTFHGLPSSCQENEPLTFTGLLVVEEIVPVVVAYFMMSLTLCYHSQIPVCIRQEFLWSPYGLKFTANISNRKEPRA